LFLPNPPLSLCTKDMFLQVLVNAAYTVSILVLPVLLKLNYLPRWVMMFCLYPLYNFPVNKSGMGDAFSPNVVWTFNILASIPLRMNRSILGSVLGGMIGGRFMNVYFPDDNRAGRVTRKES
jgi:hypothetical protein